MRIKRGKKSEVEPHIPARASHEPALEILRTLVARSSSDYHAQLAHPELNGRLPVLNQATRDEPFPLPPFDELVRRVLSTETVPAVGSIVDGFRLLRVVGSGGTNTVFEAVLDKSASPKHVAVKLPHIEAALAEISAGYERHALMKLRHPNIARLYKSGATDNGIPYLVMELVEGKSLVHHVRQKKPSLKAFLDLFLKACGAVSYIHRKGFLHLDIKPGNILVNRAGRIKLVDFGICRQLTKSGASLPSSDWMDIMTGFTVRYASPEQKKSQKKAGPLTPASDIYSLGVVLREIVAQYPARNARLKRVIAKATAANPSSRYQSVRNMMREIRGIAKR